MLKEGSYDGDFPKLMEKGRENKEFSLYGPYPNGPKKNHFYVLQEKVGKGLIRMKLPICDSSFLL